ncbi:Uncharacterized protein ESCO_003880 [Escovopsis weberi]|uniref:Methyltransferase-like protein 4 n=1 Tax=Escovopsis weberi TaxID=150374 RepID=A0A0M8N0Q2_ESCWE|nr:Uncharacterized protein ESCO_003880 [Escovopsis weberi]
MPDSTPAASAPRLDDDDDDDDDDISRATRPSSVLSQSHDASVLLLDIPASLEEAQVLPGHPPPWRLLSAPPPTEPFALPEPRHASSAHDYLAASRSPASHVAELMASAAARGALDHLSRHHAGPYCLERRLAAPGESGPGRPGPGPEPEDTIPLPPGAEALQGSIQETRQAFLDRAPHFRLILLDPPWPNRSVRRKTDAYTTAANMAEMRSLLSSIPVPLHLADDGLVAVWITNKPAVLDLLTAPTGLFASWGLELVAEWTWLKITASGEPLFDLDSAWRKPWERLLIARRAGAKTPPALGDKVVVAVPDAHSRKPCLRGQFQAILGEGFPALEVFARSLTAGWWSWGNEVLHFQNSRHWVPAE